MATTEDLEDGATGPDGIGGQPTVPEPEPAELRPEDGPGSASATSRAFRAVASPAGVDPFDASGFAGAPNTDEVRPGMRPGDPTTAVALARLERECRAAGLSAGSITVVIGAASRFLISEIGLVFNPDIDWTLPT